ncbi:MAG: TRAP transporter substrate-binding protein [Proteobacteria bacterium]|nr:TRAP transporter substrate-binding protein [Pseudomonadota bacterium]
MRTLSRLLITMGAVLLSLTAAPAFAQTEISISSWVPPSHFLNKDFLAGWAQEVEKATSGRVKFRFLPKMVSSPGGHFDAVKDGLADLAFVSHSYTPARFQLVRFGVLPFGGNNAEAQSVAVWRTYEKFMLKANEHAGVKLLTIYAHGPGIMYNTKRPINKLADLQGLKFRVGGGMAADVGQAIGATILQKPAPESYELLSQGIVDGVFFPGESPVSFKLEKLLRYATEFPGGLYSDTHSVIMNEAKFASLPKQDQDIVMKLAGDHMAQLAGKAWDKYAAIGETGMKAAGMQLLKAPAPLVAEVRERTKQFEADWIKDAAPKGIDGAKVMASFHEELKKLEGGK